MMIGNAGLAVQGKPKTITAAESWIGLLTSRACGMLVVLSLAIEHKASI